MGAQIRIHFAGNRQTGVDTGMHGQALVDFGFELGADLGYEIVNLPGGHDGPDRIVLMGLGDTENRHDGIPGELFNESFIFGNDGFDLIEDSVDNIFDFFRIQFFRNSGVSRQV